MSSYTDTTKHLTILESKFNIGDNTFEVVFDKNIVKKNDVLTYDYRYGNTFFVKDVQSIDANTDEITLELITEEPCWEQSSEQIYNMYPGMVYMRVSTCVGEYDTLL